MFHAQVKLKKFNTRKVKVVLQRILQSVTEENTYWG